MPYQAWSQHKPPMISSNPHLKVSAEGQNGDNEIASTNIVEVVVIDDLNSDSTASNRPIVKVNGRYSPHVPVTSGGWYGYFADEGHQPALVLAYWCYCY